MTDLVCEPLSPFSLRRFWTTQPDSCGVQDPCGYECGRPGLLLHTSTDGATFDTSGWVRSLAINMLMTDARKDPVLCGHAPGSINGHWSESYMDERKAPVGSKIRYIDSKLSIREVTQLVKAEVIATLQKLVFYEIAVSIEAEAEYRGEGMIFVDVRITGILGETARVGMTAKRSNNSWAWI